ncbi:MAG: hypothetical protein IJQ08_03845 [Synergistaceae bacterium]|nr:hypothetical protein [Synergistaceae bacterium]
MQSSKSQSDLIPSMFVATAVAMIFNQLTSHGAELIDGIIASRALGGQLTRLYLFSILSLQ